MKIDIHTHTKQCKSGDAPTREISPSGCCEKVLSTEVGIIAITNHNVFDLEQYRDIEAGLGENAQVWPGIELDVLEDGSRGHMLVIVSPKLSDEFSFAVNELTEGSSPDSFTATIDDVLEKFDSLRPLYIAHYHKKPNISDGTLNKLLTRTSNPSCVIKEVTNSISAGIYISHGHASIYGSDVQDWADYERCSRDLPDLRLPVDSFEHFCLLLEKDPATINTVLDRKTSEDLELDPFDDGISLKFRAFNDINVIFGPKGTGKSCILKAIAKYYSESGIDASVFESASDRLDEIFDIKGKALTVDLDNHAVNSCSAEIERLRAASELGVTSLSKYVAFFSAETKNRNAKKILLKDIDPEEEGGAKRDFLEFSQSATTTADFLKFLAENTAASKEISKDEHAEVTRILSELLERLRRRKWTSFLGWKAICWLNSAISTFRREVERKTGMPAKPTTVGFRDYAINRIRIERDATEIIRSIDTEIPMQSELVGSLGPNKGDLAFRTELKFQSGDISDGSLSSLGSCKKGTQKKFVKQVRKILSHAYADDLFQAIASLNRIEDVEDIKSVYDLLIFRRYFALAGVPYLPSSGEASMVMLQKELATDKEVYILDEPERSLDNEYINDVILPLIKERAQASRKIFISTHDANIAVRTLPYSSVYRCHGPIGYSTYIGNPFTNNLASLNDEDDKLNWKEVSMKTLEGGKEAFGERGKIYGNS